MTGRRIAKSSAQTGVPVGQTYAFGYFDIFLKASAICLTLTARTATEKKNPKHMAYHQSGTKYVSYDRYLYG